MRSIHRPTAAAQPLPRAPGLLCTLALAAALAAALVPPPAWAAGAARPPSATPGATQPQRVALVIGNASYREAPLVNPANDARAIAAVLREAGFTVLLHIDLDQRGLAAAVREFGERLRKGGVGLFYFAGHGMQIKGRNYLVPVGADIQREDEVAYAALDAQAVLDKMESAGNGTNLMILDACRNNPFARSFRSASQGLAPMEAPVGTLVAFATAPGAVASDGTGSNGLYTQHLLSAMRRPGAKVEDVFKQVRAAVRRDSQGKQIPWEATSLEGDLYIVEPPPPPPPPAPPPDPNQALEASLWNLVRDSNDPLELRAFVTRFPQGRYAATARARLAALAERVAAAPPPAPVSPVPALAPAAAPAPTAPAGARPPALAPATATATAAAVPMTQRDDEARNRRTQELLAEFGRRPPGAAAAPQPLPAAGRDDGSREQRTAELLAELRRPGSAGPAASPPPTPAVAAGGGDRWSMRVIDRWNGQVLRHYTLGVAQVDAAGNRITGSGSVYDALMRPSRIISRDSGETVTYSSPPLRWWDGMQPGQERRQELRITVSQPGGGLVRETFVQARARVAAIETVEVPAGRYEAFRVEMTATQRVERPGQADSHEAWTHTFWYVPELRYYAASELEVRDRAGALLRREREELTSLVLKAGDLRASR
ncbi:MAG: caspase domain-containing protein [Betaproteobacteria bacterium]|nr:caspase family protein [Rubrivivax sp.]